MEFFGDFFPLWFNLESKFSALMPDEFTTKRKLLPKKLESLVENDMFFQFSCST